MYAQIVDQKGNTLLGSREAGLGVKMTSIEKAKELGMKIAKMTIDKKIRQVVFDRGRYAYHGKVKALAEGAREGGLEF